MQMLLQGRQLLEGSTAVEVLPIAGVTFDGRQDLLRRLHPRQAVMAVREPYNPHDPAAVRLETAAGEHLGYVPRRATSFFQREVSWGIVESVGPAGDSGCLGARVRLWPALPAVTLDLLPASWAAQTDLPQVLGAELWQRLSSAAVARAKKVCEATGAYESEWVLIEAVPILRYNPEAKVVSAVELGAWAGPVARAARLDLLTSRGQRESALKLLAGINGWGREDLEGHLRHAHRRRLQLEAEGWTFDATPLKALAARLGV